MKYFCLVATGVGLLITIYYNSKKSILIEITEKMTMTEKMCRDQSTQTLISLDRDEGILVKETFLNSNNNIIDDNVTNTFVNKWYDIII